MQVPIELALAIGTLLVSGGVSWGAVRVGLNGTRGDVKEIRTTLNAHVQADNTLQVEQTKIVTRIETKLDTIIEDLDDEKELRKIIAARAAAASP